MRSKHYIIARINCCPTRQSLDSSTQLTSYHHIPAKCLPTSQSLSPLPSWSFLPLRNIESEKSPWFLVKTSFPPDSAFIKKWSVLIRYNWAGWIIFVCCYSSRVLVHRELTIRTGRSCFCPRGIKYTVSFVDRLVLILVVCIICMRTSMSVCSLYLLQWARIYCTSRTSRSQ